MIDKAGKVELHFTPADGSEKTIQQVHDFKGFEPKGVYLGMFNTEDSIRKFAKSCLSYSLNRKMPLKFSTKNTILKKYDGLFMDIFEEEFQNNYKA